MNVLPLFGAKLCVLTPALFVLTASALFSAINPDHEALIDDLIDEMTIDEKLGQISMIMENTLVQDDVTTNFIGSILVGPGVTYHPGLETPPVAPKWADRYDSFQNAAQATRLNIPLLVVADAVHGHALAVGATVFPHNIGLASYNDPDLMRRLGELVAREVASTGVDGILGPCVAMNRDLRWGRTYEAWGDLPEMSSGLFGAFIEGVQTPYNDADSILACAKHFIGDGGATWGTGRLHNGVRGIDRGDMQVSEAELRAIHLPPYEEAVEAGVSLIMACYGKWNGDELHHHKYLLTDVLKTELGFDGVLVSDFNGFIDEDLPAYDTMAEAAPSALNAGIDVFMMGVNNNLGINWRDFVPVMKAALDSGSITQARLDDAVRRMLRIKLRHGLFDNPMTDREMTNGDFFGSDDHREISREAAQKSFVLLRNQKDILPLAKNQRILVAGAKANDLGMQCGGWTIEFNGVTGTSASNYLTGTTLFQGIQAAVEDSGGSATYSADGSASGEFDLIVVAVGENPSAEWFGDNINPGLINQETVLLRNLQAKGIPMVVVFFANRPLAVTNQIDLWDAVVMAWLPGTEGGLALADCLFGDVPFTGKLPIAWPRSGDQIPVHFGDIDKNPLFPRGYGLQTTASTIATTKPAPARVNQSYTYTLQTDGLASPQFTIEEGSLPNGIVLNTNGQLTGTPTSTGYYHLIVKATGTDNGQQVERYQGISLSVVDKTFYEQWAAGITWPAPANETSLRDADADNDGIVNSLEFLLGMNPLVADAELWPAPTAAFASNNRTLHLRLNLLKDRALTSYLVESSQNLQTWTPLTNPPVMLSEDATSIEYEHSSIFSNIQPFYFRVRLLEE